MSRRAEVEAMLRRYGEAVELNGADFSALLRPLRFDASGSTGQEFLYTGPANHPLAPGDTVTAEARAFTVVRTECVRIGGEALYTRAVLREVLTAVTLATDAGVIATAGSCSAAAARNAEAAVSFGETEPYAVSPGAASYELTLTGIVPAEGVDLFALGEFQVVLRGGGKAITYCGCRWKNLAESSAEPLPTLTALAAGRTDMWALKRPQP